MVEDKILIEKSLDGFEVIKVIKDNKSVYIGSKYNMSREINNFIEKINKEKEIRTVIVFGLATGVHIKELINNNKLVEVYVIEPNKKILEYFEGSSIENELLSSKRVSIFYYNKNNNVDIEKFIDNIITDINLEYFEVYSFANYELLYSEEHLELLNIIKNRVVDVRINKNTSLVFSKLWFDIFIRNMLNLKNAYLINNLKDIYKDKTAVIVSAGPSLEKNIDNLKGKEDELVIITGGRTLGTLISRGIRPDFLCVVDPADISYKLVENYINLDVPLIFYEGTNADIIENYKGKKFFYAKSGFVKDFLNLNIDTILSGGSVAITCLGLAIYMGCKNIIFIGQDLALTNDKLHADIAKIENAKNNIEDSNTFYVKSIDGGKVKTRYDLNMFRKTIESIIKIYKDVKYINATEGGAHIEGTEVMSLKEAIDRYSVKDLVKIDINKLQFKKLSNEEFVKEKLNYALKDFGRIRIKCNEGIKIVNEIKTLSKKGKNIYSKLKKLDLIDKEIKQRFNDNGFVNIILYPITVEILADIKNKILDDDTEEVKFKKALNITYNLYSKINDKLYEVIKILKVRLE